MVSYRHAPLVFPSLPFALCPLPFRRINRNHHHSGSCSPLGTARATAPPRQLPGLRALRRQVPRRARLPRCTPPAGARSTAPTTPSKPFATGPCSTPSAAPTRSSSSSRRPRKATGSQYGELRTKLTELAKNGAYYKEFITQSDWFHTGEGMRAFFLHGPLRPQQRPVPRPHAPFRRHVHERGPRSAQLRPGQQGDQEHLDRQPRAPCCARPPSTTGSATPSPAPSICSTIAAGRGKLLDLRLTTTRCSPTATEYLDSVGDNPLNLASTILGLNAYMLTGDAKYRELGRSITSTPGNSAPPRPAATSRPTSVSTASPAASTTASGGKAPTAGTSPSSTARSSRSRTATTSPPAPGPDSAMRLTADRRPELCRRPAPPDGQPLRAEEVENGRTLLPQMYGDPRGYKHDGPPAGISGARTCTPTASPNLLVVHGPQGP